MNIPKIVGIVGAATLLLSACTLGQKTTQTTLPDEKKVVTTESAMVKETEKTEGTAADIEEDSKMAKETPKMEQAKQTADKESMKKSEAKYVEYTPTAVADATQNGGKAVIFFHATWCPTCAIANKEFTENMSQIPAGVTVIKTDYDSMTDLKKKYGVTSQHTFVQVDAQGNKLAIWNGGGISELTQNLK